MGPSVVWSMSVITFDSMTRIDGDRWGQRRPPLSRCWSRACWTGSTDLKLWPCCRTLLCCILFSPLLDMHNTQNVCVFAFMWVNVSHTELPAKNMKLDDSVHAFLYVCVCVCLIMIVKWSQCLCKGLFNIGRLKERIVLFIELFYETSPAETERGCETKLQILMSLPSTCTLQTCHEH